MAIEAIDINPFAWPVRGMIALFEYFEPARPNPAEQEGKELTGWCIAINSTASDEVETLAFLHTGRDSGNYHEGYFYTHGIQSVRFRTNGVAVKSRESDALFMIMEPNTDYSGDEVTLSLLTEYARRWDGYIIQGDEKAYYLDLIKKGIEAKQ